MKTMIEAAEMAASTFRFEIEISIRPVLEAVKRPYLKRVADEANDPTLLRPKARVAVEKLEKQGVILPFRNGRSRPGVRAGSMCPCIGLNTAYLRDFLHDHKILEKELARRMRLHATSLSRYAGRNAKPMSRIGIDMLSRMWEHLPKKDLDMNKLIQPYTIPHKRCRRV